MPTVDGPSDAVKEAMDEIMTAIEDQGSIRFSDVQAMGRPEDQTREALWTLIERNKIKVAPNRTLVLRE